MNNEERDKLFAIARTLARLEVKVDELIAALPEPCEHVWALDPHSPTLRSGFTGKCQKCGKTSP